MGTISDKLTYLNTTKTMLRDSLNKYGSNILTTDTFRSYDTKLNEIYNKLPKVTQSGAGFTIENVQNGQVDDFKMIGVDLEQDTTTGKQLFDINSEMNTNSLIDAGITSAFNEDGTITVNGEKTANYKYIRYYVTLPAGTYYFCGCPSGGSNSSYSSLVQLTQDTSSQVFDIGNGGTFTLTEQTTIQYFPVRVGNASLTFNNTIFKPMISTTPITYDDFEPYTGGIASPNPDYPQEIKVVEGRQVITDKGKNLFDKDNAQILNGYIKDDNGIDSQRENWSYLQSYVSVLPNTTYTISGKLVQSSNNIRTYYYDNSKNWISKSAGAGAGINIFTFTTPNNCYYIQFQMNTNYYDINSIQIEENPTATDYEPYYNPVSYNIDLTNDLLKYSKCDFTPTTTSWYFLDSSGSAFGSNIGTKTNIKFPVEINKKYTLRYNISIVPNSFQLCYDNENIVATLEKNIGNNSFTFTSNRNGYVIPRVRVNASSQVKITGISVVEGEEDYYDYKLAKMPNTDYKNRIYKNNGNWYFEKNIKKIDSYNGETITTSYMSTTGQLTTGVTIYYALATPETTQIANTILINQLKAISVHTGTNIIELSSDNNMTPQIEITRLKELEKLS